MVRSVVFQDVDDAFAHFSLHESRRAPKSRGSNVIAMCSMSSDRRQRSPSLFLKAMSSVSIPGEIWILEVQG